MKLHQKISLILFGLFLTIVILEIGLRIGGFVILSIQEYRNLQSIKQKGSLRIMCLGESTTQGTYPPYLEEILNQRNIGIKFSVIDRSQAGTRTAIILSELEANLDKYQPDIVVTMMGINDEGHHMLYEAASTSKIIATLHSFKIYKLTRLLQLHITYRFQGELAEAEQSFKKAIELNPNSESAYRELGGLYRFQGKFAKSEQSFKKAIELNPNSEPAYRELGGLYKAYGKLAELERAFRKAIELNPNSDSAYRELGGFYKAHGKLAESEQAFKKAIELNPKNVSAYLGLGGLYRFQGKLAESEQAFRKAIELNPKDYSVSFELGRLYKAQGRPAELEQVFKKAIELNTNSESAYRELGGFYNVYGKLAESEQAFKKAIELDPDNERLYRSLAVVYCEIGNNELSNIYAEKANSIIDEYYYPATVNNYHVLKQILDKRKIKLVCVEYPMRNIRPLKKIFKEEMEGGIIFVDNEKVFKDAVRKEGYKEYFRDMFGGDFGHCTKKGNRLLAENIANAILKEIFGK